MNFKEENNVFPLQDLPYCALKVVFEYLSFEQVTAMKGLCRSFRKVAENNLTIGLRSALAYAKLKMEKLKSVETIKSLFLDFLYLKLEFFNQKLLIEMGFGVCLTTERVDRYFPGHILDLFYKTEKLILRSRLRPMAPIFGRFSRSIDKAASQFDAKIRPELEGILNLFLYCSEMASLREMNMKNNRHLEQSFVNLTKYEESLKKDMRTLKRKRNAEQKVNAAKKAKLE